MSPSHRRAIIPVHHIRLQDKKESPSHRRMGHGFHGFHGFFLLGGETFRIGMQLRGRAVGGRQGFVWIQNGLARTADWSLDPARPRRYPINRSEKSVPDPNQALPVSLCSTTESKRPSAGVLTFRKDPWESVKSVSRSAMVFADSPRAPVRRFWDTPRDHRLCEEPVGADPERPAASLPRSRSPWRDPWSR